MRFQLSLLLSTLPLLILAGKSHEYQPLRSRHPGRTRSTPTNTTNTANTTNNDCSDDIKFSSSTSKYTLVDFYQGESFLKLIAASFFFRYRV